MKSFLKLILLPLCVLSSCDSTNLSSDDSYNDLIFLNPMEENDITTIITNLNENLTKIKNDDLALYAKVEENFLSLCIDIPLSYKNEGRIINYMAFNVNRKSYINTSKDENEKQTTKDLLANNSFRRAIYYGINKNKLVDKHLLNNYTYLLKDYVVNEYSYNKDKANELFNKAKDELNIKDTIIHLDVICLNNNESFANNFKENIEGSFNKQIIIDKHVLSNLNFYKANEELFDYDINLSISWIRDDNEITSVLKPLLGVLLKYNGLGY